MTSNQGYHSLFAVQPDDLDFHLRAIMEKLNDRGEVQISPLCDAAGRPSPLLGPLMKALQDQDLGIEITQLDDEDGLSQSAHAVLKVWVQECEIA